jgi:hypothetical protein
VDTVNKYHHYYNNELSENNNLFFKTEISAIDELICSIISYSMLTHIDIKSLLDICNDKLNIIMSDSIDADQYEYDKILKSIDLLREKWNECVLFTNSDANISFRC